MEIGESSVASIPLLEEEIEVESDVDVAAPPEPRQSHTPRTQHRLRKLAEYEQHENAHTQNRENAISWQDNGSHKSTGDIYEPEAIPEETRRTDARKKHRNRKRGQSDATSYKSPTNEGPDPNIKMSNDDFNIVPYTKPIVDDLEMPKQRKGHKKDRSSRTSKTNQQTYPQFGTPPIQPFPNWDRTQPTGAPNTFAAPDPNLLAYWMQQQQAQQLQQMQAQLQQPQQLQQMQAQLQQPQRRPPQFEFESDEDSRADSEDNEFEPPMMVPKSPPKRPNSGNNGYVYTTALPPPQIPVPRRNQSNQDQNQYFEENDQKSKGKKVKKTADTMESSTSFGGDSSSSKVGISPVQSAIPVLPALVASPQGISNFGAFSPLHANLISQPQGMQAASPNSAARIASLSSFQPLQMANPLTPMQAFSASIPENPSPTNAHSQFLSEQGGTITQFENSVQTGNFASAAVGPLTAPAPVMATGVNEKERLAAIYSLGILETEPRLNKITQMTARLLGGTCCVLSVVDVDRVIWKSTFSSSSSIVTLKEEPRYESYCSWVVQDETGRGVTILDSKTDPRTTHMRSKPGLEFYAGVPILSSDRKKLGALSIRGSPRTQFSVMDMNILHEMASWASGELETISQQREVDIRETHLRAKTRIWRLVESMKETEKAATAGVLDRGAGIVREAVKANYVILLKISTDQPGSGFKSIIQSVSCAPGAPVSINVGDEAFYDLCLQTLKKESGSAPLLLDPLSTGPVTKDVDRYLNKNVLRCVSELIWGYGRPLGVLAFFFEGNYHTLTTQDFDFMTGATGAFSALVEKVDIAEGFAQVNLQNKNLGAALRKNPLVFGSIPGLAPVVILIDPIIPNVKNHPLYGEEPEGVTQSPSSEGPRPLPSGPKGHAHAQAIAQINALDSGTENQSPASAAVAAVAAVTSMTPFEMKKPNSTSPYETIDIVNDFTSMVDILADRHSIKRPKRVGNSLFFVVNTGDNGTHEDAISMAHELSFALDVYNQKTNRAVSAKVGLHLDFVPAWIEKDTQALRDAWLSIVSVAYQLVTVSDSVLVSDTFYHQTKDRCTYQNASQIFVKGQGTSTSYKLIGMANSTSVPDSNEPIKDNGVNPASSLISSKMPTFSSSNQNAEVPVDPTPVPVKDEKVESASTKKKKSRACLVM